MGSLGICIVTQIYRDWFYDGGSLLRGFINLAGIFVLLQLDYMLKVEHIGIAVKDLAQSMPLFEKLLNTPCYKTEAVASEQVTTAFFRQGDNKIELLESTDPNGVIARFIEKKGEGIHHIAFEVEDIEA
jgi:4-hydroxyphenylpyruvate dioxygenase-like putative hemolysin